MMSETEARRKRLEEIKAKLKVAQPYFLDATWRSIYRKDCQWLMDELEQLAKEPDDKMESVPINNKNRCAALELRASEISRFVESGATDKDIYYLVGTVKMACQDWLQAIEVSASKKRDEPAQTEDE